MKYHIQLFLSMSLFALSFVWSKQALSYMSPAMLITFRVIIAAIAVGFFALCTKQLQRVTVKDLRYLTLIALAEPVGYFLFENEGLDLVSPTLACLVIGVIPVVSPFAAHFINGEKISRNSWAGLFVSFSGVVVVLLSEGMDALSGNAMGILLLLGAVVSSIVYYTLLQRIARRLSSYTIITYINLLSLIFLVPVVLIFDFKAVSVLSFSEEWLYPVIMLGVLCSSVAFILNTNGIRALGVTRATMYINLMPGITALFSYILLGESITWVKMVGIAVTIVGLFIANTKK